MERRDVGRTTRDILKVEVRSVREGASGSSSSHHHAVIDAISGALGRMENESHEWSREASRGRTSGTSDNASNHQEHD